ncbi:mucin-associated surface protein (MASP), putative [Trypanosoma cruzi marinkellei]|uniref:Mucin-associated surface protein (MASP), putative n=1 Tax=Trypanosoma cruzi marinkellei TaxID=85056 RepID=K2MQI2_TRYCR|nr:mucin-associated surface protein (MASP), putative [Trypanosoma cruzi marinkellei]
MVAMMMTGRVLLVCALCVLWCGIAGGGYAREECRSEVEGNVLAHTNTGGNDVVTLMADCGLLSTQIGRMRAVEAAGDEAVLSGDIQIPSVDMKESSSGSPQGDEAPVVKLGEIAASTAARPLVPVVIGTKEGKETLNSSGQKGGKDFLDSTNREAPESQDQNTGQLSSSSGSSTSSPPLGVEPALELTSKGTQLSEGSQTAGDSNRQDNPGNDGAKGRVTKEADAEKKEKRVEKRTRRFRTATDRKKSRERRRRTTATNPTATPSGIIRKINSTRRFGKRKKPNKRSNRLTESSRRKAKLVTITNQNGEQSTGAAFRSW